MGIREFFRKYLFNDKWKCNACGKEIFSGEYFCEKCLKTLPLNQGLFCKHCGRKVEVEEDYCTTCKNTLVSIDKGRSSFNYEKPISTLIHNFKYKEKRYLVDMFCDYLEKSYKDNSFDCDLITFVPMTSRAEKDRGYNQSQLLAEGLGKRLTVPVLKLLEKTKDTPRQATISRQERLVNLKGCFRVIDRKSVKDKKIAIIDDVATTGSTGEVLAEKLKKAGAKAVYLLTVASVPPKDKY